MLQTCRHKRERGRDRVAKTAKKKDMEQYPIPIKKLISSKQPSLIFSTSKRTGRTRALHTQVCSLDLFVVLVYLNSNNAAERGEQY